MKFRKELHVGLVVVVGTGLARNIPNLSLIALPYSSGQISMQEGTTRV